MYIVHHRTLKCLYRCILYIVYMYMHFADYMVLGFSSLTVAVAYYFIYKHITYKYIDKYIWYTLSTHSAKTFLTHLS